MNLPEIDATKLVVAKGGDDMPTGDNLRKYIIAFVTAVFAIGSGVALTHVGQGPDRTATTVDGDRQTVGEGRNLTREILRSRREHAEAPAEARPDPSLGARLPVVKEAAVTVPKEPVAAKEAAKQKPATVAAVVLPRSRPDGVGEPAPNQGPGAMAAGATVSSAPGPNTPVPNETVPNATAMTEAPVEQSRSFGSVVFSTVSDLSGKAANITGDTANFVIDLPGRLISAGGRLFERPQAPPPKREAL
jgi:hypothetical protein